MPFLIVALLNNYRKILINGKKTLVDSLGKIYLKIFNNIDEYAITYYIKNFYDSNLLRTNIHLERLSDSNLDEA